MSSGDGGKARPQRGLTGCLTCRARKTKCDEDAGTCRKCKKRGSRCVWGDNTSLTERERKELSAMAAGSQDLTQAGLGRRRIAKSCTNCRSVRQKCSGDLPGCFRCRTKSLNCVYASSHEASSPTIQSGEGFLADRILLGGLVDAFFREIAPLRCFGFIHKPSFMQRLDEGFERDRGKNALLYAVCALATKTANKQQFWNVGTEWAKAARKMLFDSIDDISVRNLMCTVLLHEHATCTGELGLCFMFSSIAARLCQALQLNLEADYDVLCANSSLPPTEKESRRRLMWACYLIDVIITAGVDQLQLIRASDIKIQLPCDDQYFLLRRACITETLEPGSILEFIPLDQVPADSAEKLGYRAYFVRLTSIRSRILRYIKHYTAEEVPWNSSSTFQLLLNDLNQWRDSLPEDLAFTEEVIYLRKDQLQLAPLVYLHSAYHTSYCDLYRIMVPFMAFPPEAHTAISLCAPSEFFTHSQQAWFHHSTKSTEIFRIALQHAPVSMSERSTAMMAYEGIRVQLVYITKLVPEEHREAEMPFVSSLLDTNLTFLRTLQEFHPSVQYVTKAAEKLTAKLHSSMVRPDESGSNSPRRQNDLFPVQASADVILHPLSTFRLVRAKLPERHAPETTASFTPGMNNVVPFSPLSMDRGLEGTYERWLTLTSNQDDRTVFTPWSDTNNGHYADGSTSSSFAA